MRFFRKNTQTLIGSWISIIIFLIYPNITQSQVAYATVDPLAVPNNKFGIHILQATPDESSPAAQLVNTKGDWGYITVLIESKDRNHEKWQEFFNDLRRRHLIPIVRLATQPDGNYWKKPYEGEEEAWADFLDGLNWPVKNRYVIIYNEPNHANEWGNKIDAKSYAEILDKTITALKSKNRDFFVLNGGLDASAPSQNPRYEDELTFLRLMSEAVPGIFNKLDGWVSHSYPNPEFAGSPDASGRGTVRTYFWELNQLRSLGVTKNLPVFITETGWKHAEGIELVRTWPDADTVAGYYKNAFENAWNNNVIAAVTPFLLSYQETPFDHFSFKKLSNDHEYYPMYAEISDLSKVSGRPVQEVKAKLVRGEIYSSIVSGETYSINLTFKNIGQSIWNDRNEVSLVPVWGGADLGITAVAIHKDRRIEPGEEYMFKISLKAPQSGIYQVSLNLFEGGKQFESEPVKFTTSVKSPVILKIMGALGWRKNFEGNYVLKVKGASGNSTRSVTLNYEGISPEMEAKYLLPDYLFEFSLEKPFYKPKTIKQKVYQGVNTLNFGTLNPDILSIILHPKEALRNFDLF